jgi:hypothetical protein
MSWSAVAVGAGTVISGVLSSRAQRRGASEAAGATTGASRQAIEEQRRQFDEVQRLLAPFVSGGESALTEQLSLLGLGGAEAEQAAIRRIEESPTFEALTQQGEEAILQQASATGGLRGGNVQRALAEFRPAVLSQLIEQQFGRLQGVSGLGQASAAQQAAAAQQTGAGISGLFGQQGAAQAQAALAGGAARSQLFGDVSGGLGFLAGSGALSNLFGGSEGITPNPAGQPQAGGRFGRI